MKIRNILKKTLAVVLAFAMSAPIIGNLEVNVKEAKASETTSNVGSVDSLDVKFQVTQGVVTESDIPEFKDKYVLRAVSAIQNPEAYDYIRFKAVRADAIEDMTEEEIEKYASEVKVKTVFKRIDSTTGSINGIRDTYAYSPKVVDTNSEYFATARFIINPEKIDTDYVIWVCGSINGNKVTGPKRQVCVNDGLENCSTVNMSFESVAGLKKGDELTAKNVDKDGNQIGDKTYSATVIGVYGNTVNVRISDDAKSALKSATKFEFYTSGENAALVGSEILRIHTIEYNGSNADTSWYELNPSANEFVIGSSADLYGLADLVNDGVDNFSNNTIIQVCDIEVNKGTAGKDGWTSNANETKHEWTQIGTSAHMFSGTFDGDSNTISGVVDEDTTFESVSVSSGLFGYTAYGSLISNLKIKNSKFEFNYINSGAVVGDCKGSLENIYVDEDVYVKSLCNDDDNVGGIVGRYLDACDGSQANEIKNCWFAGTVEGKAYVGGIVGRALQGKLTLDNCLLTGTVISTSRMGGIVGDANGNYPNKMNLTIKNSISAGIIDTTEPLAAGTVIGMPMFDSNITIENVYSNEDKIGAATGIGYLGNVSTVTINGLPMEFTDNLNGANAYTNTELDFWSEDNEDGVWVAIDGSTPVLKVGADVNSNSVIKTFTGKQSAEGWYYNAYTCSSKTMQLPAIATFRIDCAADLNGFEEKCNSGNRFTGQTVQLTADIDLNEGWTPQVDASGALTISTGLNKWTPIGNRDIENSKFNGTFDGGEYSIRGLYVDATTKDAGLFGYTGTEAKIKNIRMYDGYIDTNGNSFAGAIVGSFCGSLIENIYVDESVTIFGADAVGGICGAFFAGATRTISKCWFDGKAYASKSILGGIVGYIVGGTNTISDCLFTGMVTSTVAVGNKASAGGLIGDNITAGTSVTDCLSNGEICVFTTVKVNSICGDLNGDGLSIAFEDVYTTNEISCTTNPTYDFEPTEGTIKYEGNATEVLSQLNDEDNVWIFDDVEQMPILNILQ